MGLRARILRVVAPDSGGPRKRNVLEGLARGREDFRRTFSLLLSRGELVMYGARKHARYGLPRARR